jgi:hypothetical protein|tara:strand:- start:65 stop:274 length:210 start_codon:yes stop_codon:yes gene_type:complete
MKIIKIIQKHKPASADQIKSFIYKNMSSEMIAGLEYDDPKAIKRALKMFGIPYEEEEKKESTDETSESK